MEPWILDTNFNRVCVVDTFESLIWTDRFFQNGDFELYVSLDQDALKFLDMADYYLVLNDSEHAMIIERFQLDTDSEAGPHLKVTGRSLESILSRRIIWGQVALTGNLQNGIKQLIDSSIISPDITDRKIPNFVFEVSTDPIITALTVDAQYYGDNLYDVIQKLCETNKIGFKITMTSDNIFVFKLYTGIDRSYNQEINPHVIFSPDFDNLSNSSYVRSKDSFKNVTMVAGEGEGSARKIVSVGSGVGLDRREIFTDASGVSSNVNGTTISDSEYSAQLTQKGTETINSNQEIQTFDGTADVKTETLYVYGRDFFMGDIVQIVNEYGLEASSRVVELIHSQSSSDVETYPTFASA